MKDIYFAGFYYPLFDVPDGGCVLVGFTPPFYIVIVFFNLANGFGFYNYFNKAAKLFEYK
jgi:hypothetical protein